MADLKTDDENFVLEVLQDKTIRPVVNDKLKQIEFGKVKIFIKTLFRSEKNEKESIANCDKTKSSVHGKTKVF